MGARTPHPEAGASPGDSTARRHPADRRAPPPDPDPDRNASRIGYAVGLGYPPDRGERTVSLRPGNTTVLAPTMCFHMILGMWLDQWGYELPGTFRVTEAGPPEILTHFPRRLFVKA